MKEVAHIQHWSMVNLGRVYKYISPVIGVCVLEAETDVLSTLQVTQKHTQI